MPLNTVIIRDGKALEVPWGQFHVAAMVLASAFDAGVLDAPAEGEMVSIGPSEAFYTAAYHVIAATPMNAGEYTLQNDYVFTDPMDGEVFGLFKGDVLKMWRSYK